MADYHWQVHPWFIHGDWLHVVYMSVQMFKSCFCCCCCFSDLHSSVIPFEHEQGLDVPELVVDQIHQNPMDVYCGWHYENMTNGITVT
jgi:hypothetical protein